MKRLLSRILGLVWRWIAERSLRRDGYRRVGPSEILPPGGNRVYLMDDYYPSVWVRK